MSKEGNQLDFGFELDDKARPSCSVAALKKEMLSDRPETLEDNLSNIIDISSYSVSLRQAEDEYIVAEILKNIAHLG